jgi:hypothetical protein
MIIEEFLERYNARDFDRLVECFSTTQFSRVGPYGDRIDSSAEYVEFLREVVPTLGERYRLATSRISYGDGMAVAEVIEEFEVDGELRTTPEAIVFELDEDGRIRAMRLYVQRPRDFPPAGGRRAMGRRDDEERGDQRNV